MNAPEKVEINAAGMAVDVARLQTNMPMPPRFDSVAEERLHRKQHLAAAFRIFGQFGMGEGPAGHITVRDPEHPDTFWLNPFGVHFSRVKVSNLIRVDHDGNVVEGDFPVNRAAFAIHSQVHAARPDVIAAAHSHSIYGRAWSALGRLVDPITQDACAFFEDHVVCTEGAGKVVLEAEGGRAIAAALGPHKAAIHRNHGLLTVGASVDEAVWWYVTLERTCQVQLMAEAAGTPVVIAPDDARYTRDRTGGAFAGWFSFQPLWDEVCRTDPDLFD